MRDLAGQNNTALCVVTEIAKIHKEVTLVEKVDSATGVCPGLIIITCM